MREKRFVAVRKPNWDRLEATLARLDRRGLGALTAADVDAFALAYRAVTSDLAMADSRAYDPAIIGYLNRLTARAHAYVYLGTSESGWSQARRFFTHTFPRELRRSWRPIATCVAITAISAIIAYTSVSANPINAYTFLNAQQIPVITKSLHDSNFGFDRDFAPAMSAQIITNNIRVAAIAFAGGITGGLLTVWIILSNGFMIGGLGALFARARFGLDFWATIAPHGIIELSAIQIAGGAGLLMAGGLLAPGRARRVDALVRNARRAATLALGTAGLLVVAGLIEGFFSPQRFPAAIRIAAGSLTALGLCFYVLFAGRDDVARSRVD